jgi:hypothetical protein
MQAQPELKFTIARLARLKEDGGRAVSVHAGPGQTYAPEKASE